MKLDFNTLGIDIGSTTVKIAILNKDGEIIFSDYQRHYANIQETLAKIIDEAYEEFGDIPVSPMITGSGGLTLSKHMEIPFVQEVVAVATSLKDYAPRTDVAIELGGEDAKWQHIRFLNERHMCRRYRFIYRPNGYSFKD